MRDIILYNIIIILSANKTKGHVLLCDWQPAVIARRGCTFTTESRKRRDVCMQVLYGFTLQRTKNIIMHTWNHISSKIYYYRCRRCCVIRLPRCRAVSCVYIQLYETVNHETFYFCTFFSPIWRRYMSTLRHIYDQHKRFWRIVKKKKKKHQRAITDFKANINIFENNFYFHLVTENWFFF